MEFDRFSIVLLIRPDEAPALDEQGRAALQDAHLAYLAELHEAGQLLAAGPLAYGDPSSDLRGLSILATDVDTTRALKEADPAVRAGVYRIEVLPWMVPRGAMSFAPARFPHSAAEARSRSDDPRASGAGSA